MNDLSENRSGTKLSNAFKGLCGYTLKTDYNVKLDIYKDVNATQPECSHSFNGGSKSSIIKMLAIFSVASLAICLISSLCKFFSNPFKSF